MKCPNCSREIADGAVFCGYCGATVERKAGRAAEAEYHTAHTTPAKKKRRGLKVFLVFALIGLLAGSALGFAAARGMIDWQKWLPGEKFAWTDASEGSVQAVAEEEEQEPDKKEAPADGEKEQEEAAAEPVEEPLEADGVSPAPADGEMPRPSDGKMPRPADGEMPRPSDGEEQWEPAAEEPVMEEMPEETGGQSLDEIIAERIDQQERAEAYENVPLQIIDDKAHLLSDEAVLRLKQKLKETALLTGYNIMLVTTEDLFGMDIETFAQTYYTEVLETARKERDYLDDGYAFVIDTAGREFYLLTAGRAVREITNYKMNNMFNIIQPSLSADDFEKGLMDLLENTPY